MARPAAPRRTAWPGAQAVASACTSVGFQVPVPQIGGQPLQALGIALHRGHRRRRRRRAGRSCRPARRTDRRRVPRAGPPAAGRAGRRRRPAPRAVPGRSRESRRCGCPAETAPSRSAAPCHRPVAACRDAASGRAAQGADARWRWRAPRRPTQLHSHDGVSSRGPSSSAIAAGPAAATRRSTALTSPANGARPRARVSATAVATAACGGVSSNSTAGGAQPQHVAHRFRRLPLQKGLQHRVQRAHPAQHRRGEPVRRGPVARRCRGRDGVERLLQRTAAVQHGGQQIEGGFAGRIGHGASGFGPARAGMQPAIGNVTDGAGTRPA